MSSSEETASSSEDSRLSDSSSESSEDDQNDNFEDDECEETEVEADTLCPCPLCSEQVANVETTFHHLRDQHGLDLILLRRKHGMDQMSYVKLINFLRKSCTANQEKVTELVININGCSKPVWEHDEYLQPVVDEDPLLMHWFESEEDEEDTSLSSAMKQASINGDVQKDEKIAVSASDYRQLEHKASSLSETVQALMEQINTMQSVMSRVLNEDKTGVVGPSGSKRKRNSVDENYFGSYDDFGIHDQMISDLPRTQAYELAILNNKDDFAGKVVLDVGCGTGILSMFAAKAGAKKVIGVDRSKILRTALQIIRDNGLEDKIECVSGKIEEISLPFEKVDIIISEYMGYFLLYEGMLESYLVARDRFLKPGGLMLPSTAELYVFGCDDNGDLAHHYNKWDNMHGFNMSLLKPKLDVALVETIPAAHVVTDPVQVLNLNMATCKYSDAAFTSPFKLVAQKDCSIAAVGGHFDNGFTMGTAYKHTLTTSPFAPSTHWFQTVFPLQKAIPAKKGDEINGSIQVRPNLKNPRALDIDIRIQGYEYSYKLN